MCKRRIKASYYIGCVSTGGCVYWWACLLMGVSTDGRVYWWACLLVGVSLGETYTPPVPSCFVKSPPCIMKLAMTR